MSNICENVLRVTGEHSEIVRFDEKFRGGKENKEENYNFSNLYPPPELSISEKCEWCRQHWSVKGNFYEDSFAKDTLRADEMETYYYFDTPWVGPEKLILYSSSEFTELDFMLVSNEPGNGIGVLKVYRNGEVISDEELSNEDKTYWFGEDEKTSA